MKNVTIVPEIGIKFGKIKIGYLFVENIQINSTPPREKKIAREVESKLREEFANAQIDCDEMINKWISYSKMMGITNDNEYPAHIGLIKSILRSRNIPKINNAVDAANIIAAKYRCPVGVFDANEIISDISLRLANTDEYYIPLLSNEKVKIPEGEVVYSDAAGIFSRYCKDADRTKISENTTSLFCVVDGINDTTISHVENARNELESILKEVGGNNISITSHLVISS